MTICLFNSSAGIIDGVIVLLAVAVVAVLFVFRFWKRRKKRNIGDEGIYDITINAGNVTINLSI